MGKICYVALSGGVDSAASAAILSERGYTVRGVTLRLKPGNLADKDIEDAKKVAETLSIPLDVLDMRSEFKSVTDYFCNEYIAGRTPNPCVFCNPTVKFGKMLEFALENGGDYLATGHYANIVTDENGVFYIERNPTRKDQSYFLCRLNQHILSHVIFPLSEFSKDETRAFAEKAGIPIAKKKDSQEVCFIPDNDYISFIEKEKSPRALPGNFISVTGEKLGTHSGIYKYTIGQRKGLGAFGKPMYVISIDKDANTVTIGDNEALFTKEIKIENISFLSGIIPKESFSCQVKIRCAAQPANAVFEPLGETEAKIIFEEAQRAAAPGQTAAIYNGERLLGGGTIK